MADIVLTDLTDGSLGVDNEWDGNGVFDKLIHAVNKNIEGQYNKGRITGKDYATVYLGALQSIVAQSVQYILQEKLTEAQIEASNIQALATRVKAEDENGKVIDTLGNITNSTSTTTSHYYNIERLKSEIEVADANKEKISADTDATVQQTTEMMMNGIQSRALQASQIDESVEKTLLYARQKEGFDDDARQKLLKLVLDGWVVLYSSTPNSLLIPDTLSKANIDRIMEDALIGLGVNETATFVPGFNISSGPTADDNISGNNILNGTYYAEVSSTTPSQPTE